MPNIPATAAVKWNGSGSTLEPLAQPRLWAAAMPPDEEAAFQSEQRALDFQTWRSLMLVVALLLLLWWPTDRYVFADSPPTIAAFASMRGRTIGLFLIAALLVTVVGPLHRRPMAFISCVGFAGLLSVSEAMGRLGGPGSAWFHMVGTMVMAPAAVTFTLLRRAGVTAAWVGAIIWGFCGLHPENWHDPLLVPSLSFLGALVVFSLVTGAVLDRWRRQMFVLRQVVAKKTQQLSEANERLGSANRELEERVQVKVAEALANAEKMESLALRLQEQVGDRSLELSRALARLSRNSGRPTGLAAGTILSDSVRIVRPIGTGGMGAVYLGEDLRTGEQVAVKVMLASRWTDEAMQRFLRECRAASRVSHAAVARTLSVDVSAEGLIFQIQELIDGESLLRVVEEGRSQIPAGEAARLFATLALGLAEAHAVGVVHRDLKPSNVMLTANEPG